jgi:asparagine synthase (glutamine-hydrolysing)
MCGIAGAFHPAGAAPQRLHRTLEAMADQLRRRGPDGCGVWMDATQGIGLSHRRLAVVDLSEAGAQPMLSRSGRFVLSFNGEVYNHLDIRAQLSGPWSGGSDTETLLAAIEAWGIERALREVSGMFALALWDRDRRVLALARDRFGEKPLYFGWQGQGGERAFIFGSELAALRAHPAFERRIDRDSVALFMRYGAVPGDRCIFDGLAKAPPGGIVELSTSSGDIRHSRYWSPAALVGRAASRPARGERDLVAELDTRLRRTIGRELVADVPVGVFLSGGIDSSVVAAIAQVESASPIRTFSIGFKERAFDEATHARNVAQHIGADHTELYVTPADALAVVPQLPSIYSEPFADSSQIPTYLLAKLARRDVTVALTGDGGDEVFGGYRRHLFANQAWPRLARIPKPLRRLSARALDLTNTLLTRTERLNGRRLNVAASQEHLQKLAAALRAEDLADLYTGLTRHWPTNELVVGGGRPPAHSTAAVDGLTSAETFMLWDTAGYLPDDILTKVDRAAMAASLETRAPFLDHELAEFAWSLPPEERVGRQGKIILRKVLERYVPRSLTERPKAGFTMPVGDWLRGPLRVWAEDILSPQRMARHGYLESEAVHRIWREHQSGARDHQQILWNALMFESWFAAVGQADSGAEEG